MTRVLHIIDHLGTGGAQENICEIIEGHDEQSHVATLFGGDRYDARLAASGAVVHHLGVSDNYRIVGAMDPRLVWRIRRLLAQERFDVVHLHLYVAPLVYRMARLLSRAARQPSVIISLHAERSTLPKHVWHAFRLAKSTTTSWVVPDDDVTPRDLQAIGVDSDRIQFIPYSVSPILEPPPQAVQETRGELDLPSNAFILLSAARLHPQRHIDKFIVAVAEAARIHSTPKPVLLIAGDGPQEETLKELVDQLNARDVVRFLGRRHDIPELLSLADGYLTMSVRGNVGVGAMQALTVRLPTVAWEWGGDSCELADLPADRPCPRATDQTSFNEFVARLIADPVWRDRVSNHGYDYVTKHRSPLTMHQAWRSLYGQLRKARAAF